MLIRRAEDAPVEMGCCRIWHKQEEERASGVVTNDPESDTDVTVTTMEGKRGFRELGVRGWQNRRIFIPVVAGLLLIAVLVSTAAIVVQSRQPYLTNAQATQGNLVLSFRTTGTLRSAIYGADFAVTGPVAEIDVTVGQQVAQGATLAKLDTTFLKDALAQAQSAANGASAALASAQTHQDKVQSAADALVNSAYYTEQAAIAKCNQATNPSANCVSQAESAYAAAQATADSMNAQAQQQTDSAQAQYNTAKAALQTAQDNLAAATLTAPHAGTIAAINGHIGQTTGGTKSGDNSFIEIADLNTLQITATVDESQVGNVQPQDAVRFTVPSFKNRTFSGSVSGVSPFGQTTHNVVLYPVIVDVDGQSVGSGTANATGQLLPGMTANVTVLTAQRFAVKLIPNSAVDYAHTASDPKESSLVGKAAAAKALAQARQMLTQLQTSNTDLSQEHPSLAYVLVQVKGKWVPQPVVLGLTDGRHYEVLAGLTLGQKVATGEQRNWITILRNQ
ncbi:MAG: efflux RND transporter periplasmic adaptor subunit [Nitrososphaerota archaeon]